ncbi:restriction endonuclease subunit S [Lactococcus petauri]|uniref:restriction endonuclease subunit S n=1 Tax=Lactococcus petauri TaxID=1940789 RepID=UPI003D74520F
MSKKRPQLRFKGFTDDWEEHKLGDFLKTPEKVKAHIQSKDDLMTLKLNLGGLESGSNRETLELGSTIYYKRKAGQFIYGKQNFFNGSMAIIPIDLDGKATSGDVPSLDVIGILSEYLYVYVSRGDYWKSKESEASGTGSKRIHEKTLQGFDIKVPSTQNEQRKIGSFFKQLDDTIALHQRKLDLLKEQKKGYLQKMFPKNGEKIPELRIAGFVDDWEQRKLGEMLVNLEAGVSVNSSDYDTGYFILKTSAIKMGNIDLLEVKSIVSEEVARAKTPLIKNSIIISRMNTPELVGASGLVRESIDNIFLPDRLWQGQVAGNFSPEWLIQSINIAANIKKIRDLATGTSGSMKNISKKSMLDLIINVPTLEEQQKIGSFFKQLDDVIALHQRKLDLLKEQKKGFLQKMFV